MPATPIRISSAQWQRRPWVNGKGESHLIWDGREPVPGLQILRTPIVEAAPFSDYAGWNRIFTVVKGPALGLTIDGSVVVAAPLLPVRFRGEAVVSVALPGGPAEVLNVIYARRHWRELDEVEQPATVALAILHFVGPIDNGPQDLRSDDTLLGDAGVIVPAQPGLIQIRLARLD